MNSDPLLTNAFYALSNAKRRAAVQAVSRCGPVGVIDISTATGQPAYATSRRLLTLERSCVLSADPRGTKQVRRLSNETLAALDSFFFSVTEFEDERPTIDLDRVFHVLSDEGCRSILVVLRKGPGSLDRLMAATSLNKSGLKRRLYLMRDSQLIIGSRNGRRIEWSCNDVTLSTAWDFPHYLIEEGKAVA